MRFFEVLFNKEFPITTDLKWLVNEDGNEMHLDGYNDTLKLAFEYNGIQHYIYNKYFKKQKKNLKKE